MLVLDVASGGGFVFSYRWSALGLVSDVVFGGGFALSYRWFALGVSFGRYVWRRFRPILSFALWLVADVMFGGGFVLSFRFSASSVAFGRSFLAVVSFNPFVCSHEVSVLGVILTKSEKALEFLFWLSLVGSMAFDLLENYS